MEQGVEEEGRCGCGVIDWVVVGGRRREEELVRCVYQVVPGS